MDAVEQGHQTDAEIIGSLFLVFSNLALLPAILLFAKKGDFSSAIVYGGTFSASVFYHSCRANFFCVYDYVQLRTTDYIFVYRAIVWSVTALGIRAKDTSAHKNTHIFLFFLLTDAIYFSVMSNIPFGYLPIIGIGLPLAVVIVFNAASGSRMFYNKPWTIATVVLALSGGLFMFVFPDSLYSVAHSLWHVFSMLSAYTFERASDPKSTDGKQHRRELKAAREPKL